MTSSKNDSSDSFKAIKLGDDPVTLIEYRGDGPSFEKSSDDGDDLSFERSKGDGPSLPSKQVLDLAYKIKTEEAREKQERIAQVDLRTAKMRNRLAIQFGVAGLILAFCFGVYVVYSDMSTKTKINTVEANFIEKINRAYEGQQTAYDEIVERIPVLTEGRLFKSTGQDESISQSIVSSNDVEPAIEPTAEPLLDASAGLSTEPVNSGATVEAASTLQVNVYSSRKSGAPILKTLVSDAGVLDIKQGEEWSSIMLVTGFPVWIHGDFVAEMDSNTLKVSGDRVNLRAQPDLSPDGVVGRANGGDTLQILNKSGSWYQVNSPADLKGWVKTKSLQTIL